MDFSLFFQFLLAMILGALIGIEREMPTKNDTDHHTSSEVVGTRSYAIIGFFGALMAWADMYYGNGETWKIFGFTIVAIFIGISYVYTTFQRHQIGIVSEFAGLLAYAFGMMIMLGYTTLTVILAVISLVLLSSKDYLAKIRSKISRTEMSNTIKFAVISIVILPLLPDARYSLADIFTATTGNLPPLSHPILEMSFINPYSIWFFVVVMAGIEYVGYILSKTLGNKGGAILSGAVGGLISSTAVTGAMTNKSHDGSGNTYSYAAATLIASMIMCIRVIIVSSFYNPAILTTILIPSLTMLIGLGGSAAWCFLKSKNIQSNTAVMAENYDSPFQVLPAMKFALVIVVIKFIAGIGLIYQHIIDPKIFYYVLGMISGLADVDAITMDMASKSVDGRLPLVIAATTILIATISNNIVKASIALRMGEKSFGKMVFIGFGISTLLGIIAIILMNITNIA